VSSLSPSARASDDRSRERRRLGIVRTENPNAEYDNEAAQVPTIARDAFVAEFAENYTPSHVTFIGPTRRGKTTLCFQLLGAIQRIHPKWRVTTLHGKVKGRDDSMGEWAKKNNYRIVTSGRPGPTLRPSKMKHRVNGYIVRPLKKEDISAREEEVILKREFATAIRRNYHSTSHRKDKIKITVVDERAQADKDLKLTTDLDAPLQRGLPDNPEWNLIQRGAWVSYHCYDAPEHMFIYHDDHESNRKRYSEFGCADPEVIFRLVSQLKTSKSKDGGTISQCLYMRRSDRYMCIVDT
jgi:hypothetical protein